MWYTTVDAVGGTRDRGGIGQIATVRLDPLGGQRRPLKLFEASGPDQRANAVTTARKRHCEMPARESGGAGNEDPHVATPSRTGSTCGWHPAHPAHPAPLAAPGAPGDMSTSYASAVRLTYASRLYLPAANSRGGSPGAAARPDDPAAPQPPPQTRPHRQGRAARPPRTTPACASAGQWRRSACRTASRSRSSTACWFRECAATRGCRTPARKPGSRAPVVVR